MNYRSRQRLRQKDRERHNAPDDERPKLQDYVNLPYHITLVRDEERGGWLSAVEELPGCVVRGKTQQEAASKVSNAMADWISTAIREGREVPAPKSAESHSGRLLLRMPRTLHAELTRVAERESVSLNQFITDVLAAAVGWRAPAGASSTQAEAAPPQSDVPALEDVSVQALDAAPLELEPEDAEPPRRRMNLIAAALAANFIVIAITGVVALLVLLAAWR